MDPLRNIDQLAELLGVPRTWVRDKVAARAIPFTFVGRHVRFTDDDVAAIIAAGKQPAITTPPVLTVVRRTHPPAGPANPTPPGGPGRPTTGVAACAS